MIQHVSIARSDFGAQSMEHNLLQDSTLFWTNTVSRGLDNLFSILPQHNFAQGLFKIYVNSNTKKLCEKNAMSLTFCDQQNITYNRLASYGGSTKIMIFAKFIYFTKKALRNSFLTTSMLQNIVRAHARLKLFSNISLTKYDN